MGRSRFVKGDITRLYLADVYKRAHQALLERKGREAATPDQIAESAARVTLAVSEGEFIDVKRRLNTGEQQALFAQMMPQITPGEPYRLQSKEVMTAKVLAYLLSWSLTDDDKPVPVSADAVDNLDPDTFREIREAIDHHEETVEAELDQAKKNLTGEIASKPT